MTKDMTKEDKLERLTNIFPLLPEEKQDYILGILQALVFASSMASSEIILSDTEQNLGPLLG